jgi:F-box/leucine-rich repeat protein 7
VSLTNAAKNLTHLDLSFCCALTDTSTEVVALTLPKLKELRLAFCGSAVSDGSLRCIALHLNDLEGLSVRGCVRVTGQGVESVLEGCGMIRWLDGSQCKNLEPWVKAGGVSRWGYDERGGERVDLKAKAAAEMMGLKERVTATPFRGFARRRAKGPVRFVLEKGVIGLR